MRPSVRSATRPRSRRRRRIGRDLHDDTCQSLAWLRMQLEVLEAQSGDGLREPLSQAREITERALEDLRRMLSPTA